LKPYCYSREKALKCAANSVQRESVMQFQAEEKARLRRQRVELAISLAMQGKWEEAVQVNRGLLELFPEDVDAYNRLGKALMELGRYDEARDAYRRAVEIDANNTIARKNLSRLAHLKEAPVAVREAREKPEPQLFIEETGKSGVTPLHQAASREVLARMTAGDPVRLKVSDKSLVVENLAGEYLGQLEPRLAFRLLKLMEGGNQYAAAVAGLSDTGVRVIIKETYQDPSQVGRISFPTRGGEAFRPYTRESLLRHEFEEEEGEDGEYSTEWEHEADNFHEEFSVYEESGNAEEEESSEE